MKRWDALSIPRVLFFLVASGLGSGCGGSPPPPGTQPLAPNHIEQVRKGESTKADVLRLLGEPLQKQKSDQAAPECNDLWLYAHGIDEGSYVHVDTFVVMFSPEGVVCSTSQDSTNRKK